MRTKQRAAVVVEQRLARDRAEAHRDARALAIELARGAPSARFDPMRAGVVLRPGETVYRLVPLWIQVQQDGRWADPSYANVIVTDVRLLCRMSSGRLTSLWWNGVVGLHIELASEHVVVDFGDGQPISLSGVQSPSVAVVAVASVYGAAAMLTHPGMVPLRCKSRARIDSPL